MKTLVLAPSIEGMGGIQRYTATLVDSLRQLLGPDSVRLLAIPHEPPQERLSLGVRLRFAAQALKLTATWRPSLIICAHAGLAPLAWLLRRLGRCPYWVAAHGIEVWGVLSSRKRRALREADCVLAVSAFTRNQVIRRHRVPAERIQLLPNALDERLLRARPDRSCLASLDLQSSAVLLSVARLAASERYKGHDTVLRALPRVLTKVPNLAYLIVGDGNDRPRLEQTAQQLGVRDHVVFLGNANDCELAACYAACHVFVLPAMTLLDDLAPKGEGFGIVFLEAMAFGKPVIGPAVGAPAEFIRHEEHGLLVDPQSPEEVAEALLKLLTQPELARRLGEQGRRYALQEYSQDALTRRLKNLLNLLVATR